VDVAVAGGPDLVTGLPSPGAGPYAVVPGGPGAVRVTTAGGTAELVPVDLAAGSVYSLLVLDHPDGGLAVRPVLEAAGPAVVPSGGVAAGGGGTAGRPGPGGGGTAGRPGPGTVLAVGLAAVGAVALSVVVPALRRR
jgi:hypothetical protein